MAHGHIDVGECYASVTSKWIDDKNVKKHMFKIKKDVKLKQKTECKNYDHMIKYVILFEQ